MKFLADPSLGRLAKWLRIIGCDAAYWRGEAGRPFLLAAQREGRVVLTRRKDIIGRQHPGAVLFVESDRVEDQLVEVIGKLGLAPDPASFFTVCLECNVPLQRVRPDEIRDRVPGYVYRTQREFRLCPACGRVYWPGTHRERAVGSLRRILGLNADSSTGRNGSEGKRVRG
ncbi:MAG: hypothetical protein HPY67_00920 [Syntrophaceae bacterium]|nr:hypothetical protein [Syntrophaceae bacterium]